MLISLGPTSLSPAKLPLWELESQVCSHMDYLCLSLGGRWECSQRASAWEKAGEKHKVPHTSVSWPGSWARAGTAIHCCCRPGELIPGREELWEKHLWSTASLCDCPRAPHLAQTLTRLSIPFSDSSEGLALAAASSWCLKKTLLHSISHVSKTLSTENLPKKRIPLSW